jgi:2-polyprenyl-3-methyl-5-hydroxy-6-metoxy-1,4-benzoquinol methylase
MTSTKAEEFYNSYHKRSHTNKETSILPSRVKVILKLLKNRKIENILDIGCGNGLFSSLIGNYLGTKKIFGVDVSLEAVNEAKKRISASIVNIDNSDLPFDGSFFDLVICEEVIEHVLDTDHLLLEIKRVLKNGGLCILTTPNLSSWYNRGLLVFGYQPYNCEVSLYHNVGKIFKRWDSGSGHIRCFTEKALRDLVELDGFIILDEKGAHNAEIFPSGLKWIEAMVSTKFSSLSSIMVFLLKKQ